jgi:PAS domain S-box-containing protein
MKNFRITDLVDTAALQDMADSLYESTGMPIGIIDAIDNSLLVGAGWQDICTKFHRLHPEMLSRCQESDNYIKDHLKTGESCKYKCKNGLWDIGMPIIVAGKHLATMFLGQFFYEDESPERAFFIEQGKKFGFDVEEYLHALDQVPYFTKEKVENILAYNKSLVSFITSLAESALSRNKAEQQLWEQNHILQGILEHTHMMEVYLDCHFNFVWVNRAYADTCKRPPSFFTGKNYFALYPHQENQAIFQKVVDTGEPFFVEDKPFVFPEQPERGTTYWNWSLIPVKDSSGAVIGLVFSLVEVTRRVKAEEVTRQSEEKFRTLVENTIDWVWQVDQDGIYNYVSPQVEPLLGYKPSEIVGKTPFDYMDAAETERVRKIFTRISSTQERIVGLEDRMLAKDGQEIIFETNATPLFDEQDNHIGYMGTCRDITERKTKEQEKKEADGQLLRQQKAIFLNNRIANVFLTTSGNDIFVNTLDVILETLESPYGYFGFINEEGDLTCPSMTRHIWNKCNVPDKSIIFPKETWGGLWKESLQKKETVISNAGLQLPEGHTQLTCAMAVPIIHHGELIGQFVVANKEGGYDQHEKFLLESAASQTAPILKSLLEKEA